MYPCGVTALVWSLSEDEEEMKAESASVCHQLPISISVQDNAPAE